jgi:hypothetical protein
VKLKKTSSLPAAVLGLIPLLPQNARSSRRLSRGQPGKATGCRLRDFSTQECVSESQQVSCSVFLQAKNDKIFVFNLLLQAKNPKFLSVGLPVARESSGGALVEFQTCRNFNFSHERLRCWAPLAPLEASRLTFAPRCILFPDWQNIGLVD